MRRIFLAVALLLAWVAAAWGSDITITLNAVYVDDGGKVDVSAIIPYREIEFRYSIVAATQAITYLHIINTSNQNGRTDGSIATTDSPIPYTFKATFASEEKGSLFLSVRDGTAYGIENLETQVAAIKGTPPTISVTGVKIGEDSILSTPSASMEIELDMDWNSSKTLKATVEPENATNKNVSWTSDKETVATVSNGRIEAKGPGEATITATTEDGGFKATCKVKVTRDGATSITLDQSSMFMTVGDERLISVSGNTFLRDYQKTKAELSVPDVVRVEKDNYSETVFKVTAIKAGETILTISTEGANGDTIKASCDITVTAATPVSPETPATPVTPNTPDTPTTPNTPATPNTPDTTPTPPTTSTPNTPTTNNNSGGGGGCNAGFLGLAALAALAMKKR